MYNITEIRLNNNYINLINIDTCDKFTKLFLFNLINKFIIFYQFV